MKLPLDYKHIFSPPVAKNAGVIFLVGAVVFCIFWLGNRQMQAPQVYPEVAELRDTPQNSFEGYSQYFRKLAQNKGAEYAFEVLKRASFPPGIDIHLLAHVVGDMLYKQKGIEGIAVCTPDFRNACSHSVVIGILNEQGPSALPKIAATCKKAPGGKGAYTMCFHGLGHGVLAFNGYDFEKAVLMCAKTGTPQYGYREASECIGGATMEMIAGVHDRTAWEKHKNTYLRTEDPLSPCDKSFMTEGGRPLCYTYLTPHLFEASGANLGNPDPVFFSKAFSFCDAIPESDTVSRDACYGGFGKEFIVLARARDIRDIGSEREEDLRKVQDWCARAGNNEGTWACNLSALNSLFWGGENNPDASFLYCSVMEGDMRSRCYEQLAGQIAYYSSGTPAGASLCSRLPSEYQRICKGRY